MLTVVIVEQQFRAPVSHRELPCGLGMARIRTGRARTTKIKRLSIALKRDCESMISRNYSFVLYMYIRVAHCLPETSVLIGIICGSRANEPYHEKL